MYRKHICKTEMKNRKDDGSSGNNNNDVTNNICISILPSIMP